MVGTLHVSVEIRTVNHRFFSPSIKLPSAFAQWETEVREAMRTRVSRGHITLNARTERAAVVVNPGIDAARFAEAVITLRLLSEQHGLAGGVDLGSVLRMPEVITTHREAVDENVGTAPELVAIVEHALVSLNKARAEEGVRLTAVLLERLALIRGAVERIALRAPERVIAHRDRLKQSVLELTDGVPLDDGRLIQEIALLADRIDVSEEMDRFRSHLTAFEQTLEHAPPDGVGKRLGFLLQELLREANTTGSKGADNAVLQDVVAIKEELERIREQVENLE
ncbi:MAG: YicC family protein [Phycisphaerae bacterium]|nr:YicC family protein [Gemmatimonadaceae bacterium]